MKQKEKYLITKEDYIGFWRDAGGEKMFFDHLISPIIISIIDDEIIKRDKTFDYWFHNVLAPTIVYQTHSFLTKEEMTEVLCELMWIVILVIANMYDYLFIDAPPMYWVFDTPDDPFEKYLVSKMPDAYEKYATTKNYAELLQ